VIARVLSFVVVVGAIVVATFASGAGGEGASGKRYRVVLDNAFGLTEGGEVKVGGVTAGAITRFKLTHDEPVKVGVHVEITESGFDALRTDAECAVRQQSLIGEYFLDCQVGRDGKELPDGGTVPVDQTSSTIPLDLLQTVQRLPYRERFRLILSELGAGLAGRPDQLNEVIRRAHPALRETTQTLAILARHNRIIKDFIRDADRVSHAVAGRRRDVVRWAKEASETAAVQATRREHIARQWNRLPVFLPELRATTARLEATANEQIPLLERMRTAAPKLEEFLAALGPFAEASRGSIAALGKASAAGRRAFVESREEIEQLRLVARDAPRLARPLRQLLQAIDDRSRSTEPDPLAGELAPPAPDKTAYREGQGFTGMEAFWNYIYYQALGTNAFDDVSHLLRIVAVQSPCAAYDPNPTEQKYERCGSILGPRQPGVRHPDPTEGPGGGSAPAGAAGAAEAQARAKSVEPGFSAAQSQQALDFLLGP
jgi:virulence factor Mce-like protein